jgi:hypothetical protein
VNEGALAQWEGGGLSRQKQSKRNVLNGSFFLHFLAHEDETKRFSRNVGNYQSTLCNIPEEQISHSLVPNISKFFL